MKEGEYIIDGNTFVSNDGTVVGDFYKKKKNDNVWWVDSDNRGTILFTFDKKKIYSLFADYPYNLTKEEKEIFDKENPYWKKFFEWRNEEDEELDE